MQWGGVVEYFIPEIIENNVSGILTTPQKISEIQRSIERLIEKPAIAKSLGEELYKKVQREFQIKDMVDQTVALYEI